jgi:cellulase
LLTCGADKWANQDLLDHNGTFSVKIPSDIKSGTYVLRTELLSLHGNMGGFLESYAVSGAQFYPHCFNVEITGSGTSSPDGQTFPGIYNPKEIGLNFVPYTGSGSGVQQNSKYVSMHFTEMLIPAI